MNRPLRPSRRAASALLFVLLPLAGMATATGPRLNEAGYFSTRGLDVLAFNNTYDGNFSDSKIAGVELIHHGVRTATNGDVRLSPTYSQPSGRRHQMIWSASPSELVTGAKQAGRFSQRVGHPRGSLTQSLTGLSVSCSNARSHWGCVVKDDVSTVVPQGSA